jgi:hypothetical protein
VLRDGGALGARARGRRRSGSGMGTTALGLRDGGTLGARAQGWERRRSGSRTGTAALGLGLGDGDGGSLAAQLCQLGRDELGFLPEPTSLLYCKQSHADI